MRLTIIFINWHLLRRDDKTNNLHWNGKFLCFSFDITVFVLENLLLGHNLSVNQAKHDIIWKIIRSNWFLHFVEFIFCDAYGKTKLICTTQWGIFINNIKRDEFLCLIIVPVIYLISPNTNSHKRLMTDSIAFVIVKVKPRAKPEKTTHQFT